MGGGGTSAARGFVAAQAAKRPETTRLTASGAALSSVDRGGDGRL